MPIDPNTGDIITLAEAQAYVTAFRRDYPSQPKGFFVGLTKLGRITGQTGCIGVRIYNGYDDVAKRTNLVLVGVDTNQKDMTSGIILERLAPCPSSCDVTSALY